VVCSFAVLGSLRLKVETDFIKNFRSDAPLVVAYRAVESDLGGAGVWDVLLPAPKVLSQTYLDRVAELEKRLLALEVPGEVPLQLTKVMSFADADAASRLSPILGRLSIEARLIGMRQVMGSFVDTLISKPGDGQRYLRIMLRSREQAEAAQKEQLIAEVQRTVDEAIRSGQWNDALGVVDGSKSTSRRDASPASKAVVSGYYVLLSQLVSSVVADQWRCFAVATFGIWIAMSIALRSPGMALLTVLPNALPSLCILGWMGWTGTRVNLGAAMIAAVSMGLSVDSSLHYLIRFQRERADGRSFDVALASAQSEIGMAILLSTCALVLGFGSLATSNFLPTVVFGTTASISMMGGLLGNLLVLPALLRLYCRLSLRESAPR
jgi:predicted RND superfamily exporter protein